MSVADYAYVDTSALISTLLPERHSEWAYRTIRGRTLISSVIADVELAQFSHRSGHLQAETQQLAAGISLVALNKEVIGLAKTISGELKSLDAIHLGTWLYLRAQGMETDFITADKKLVAVASNAGAQVLHPYGA